MLPINWLNHCEVPYVNVEIVQNFYNPYSTPKSFFAEKCCDSWDPKTHSAHNYLHIFNVAAIIDKCGTKKHYPLEIFRNGISKKTGSSVTGKMDYGIPLSSSDSAMTSKKKINRRAAFKIQIKNIVYLLKQRMICCLILGQKYLYLYLMN